MDFFGLMTYRPSWLQILKAIRLGHFLQYIAPEHSPQVIAQFCRKSECLSALQIYVS